MKLTVHNLESKEKGVIRMLHLSDLHFTRATQDSANNKMFLKHFENYLKRKDSARGIDLIAVTGDLIDFREIGWKAGLRTMKDVKKYLQNLCDVCQIRRCEGLVVVPGNHDLRWRGLVRHRYARQYFEEVFEEHYEHKWFPRMNLLVAAFDSCFGEARADFATGCFDSTAFVELDEELTRIPEARNAATRVALVHHHPLPVPQSEDLKPRHRFERYVGRRVRGGPEFLVFRNAGTFLQGLLARDFQVVLHGHLHHSGQWRLVGTIDHREKWLEVISTAAMGAEAHHLHQFNLLALHADGIIEGKQHVFNDFGMHFEPVNIPFAPYEIVRENHRSRPPSDPQLCCDLRHQFCEIHLPEGDTHMTELLRGVRSRDDRPVGELILRTAAATQAHGKIEAVSLDPQRLQIITDRKEITAASGGQQKVSYTLKFDPPIGRDKVDIIIRRQMFGSQYSSREVQEKMGIPEIQLGWDDFTHRVRFEYDRFLMNVRFIGQQLPPEVTLTVKDIAGVEMEREKKTSHVSFSYLTDTQAPHTIHEAIISVFKPKVDWSYGIKWPLAPVEPIPCQARARRHKLSEELSTALDSPQHRQVVQGFLEDCRQAAHDLIKQEILPTAATDMNVCFLSPSETEKTIGCRVTTNPGCPFATTTFQWGRDLVGSVFKDGISISFSRPGLRYGMDFFQPLPAEIQFLLVYPLYFDRVDGRPIAAVALTSTDPNSNIRVLTCQSRLNQQLGIKIFESWRTAKNNLLPEKESETIASPNGDSSDVGEDQIAKFCQGIQYHELDRVAEWFDRAATPQNGARFSKRE